MGFQINPNFADCDAALAAGLPAIGLYAVAGAMSSSEGLDGWVPLFIVKLWDKSARRANRLVDVELWTWGEHPRYGLTRRFVLNDDWCRFTNSRYRSRVADDLRLAVYRRDFFQCVHCGSFDGLTLDHIYPWSRGGRDALENFQTLCRPCNSRKGAKV